MAYTISVNGVSRTLDVDGDAPLLWVLRDVLDVTGPKFGCGMGLCGAVLPALCNAIYAATGVRVRRLPIRANELAVA